VQEHALLHVSSFYQYIYLAAGLDTVVASSLSTSGGCTAAEKCIQNASNSAA